MIISNKLVGLVEDLFVEGAERLDIICRRGDTFRTSISLDLVKYTGFQDAICQIRKKKSHLSDLLTSFSVSNATIELNSLDDQADTKLVTAVFSLSDQEALIEAGDYYYDLKMLSDTGDLVTTKYGRFKVIENITDTGELISNNPENKILQTEDENNIQTEAGDNIYVQTNS